MAARKPGTDRPQTDPYAKPALDEALRLAEPLARTIVRSMLVGKARILQADADWYENEARIVVWRMLDKYDPERVSKRTGKRCTFMGYVNWTLRVWAGHVLRERIRSGEDKLVSIDADPETLDRLDAEAIRAFMLAPTTSDMDAMQIRLDVEGAVGTLPVRLREAARLIFVEGVPRAEVPARLGISRSKFDHKMSAEITRRMKAALPGWEPEDRASTRGRIRGRRGKAR